jgi:hypothetical protein
MARRPACTGLPRARGPCSGRQLARASRWASGARQSRGILQRLELPVPCP